MAVIERGFRPPLFLFSKIMFYICPIIKLTMEEKLKTLQAKRFTAEESKQQYILTRFEEFGRPFAVLVENDNNRMNTGKSWKFGVVLSDDLKKNKKDKGLHWFFGGKVYARNRVKAREVYTLLEKYCVDNGLGQAFAYKVRTNR